MATATVVWDRHCNPDLDLAGRIIIPYGVGDEVTRLKFSQLFRRTLESPDVVSYLMNRLLGLSRPVCLLALGQRAEADRVREHDRGQLAGFVVGDHLSKRIFFSSAVKRGSE